MTSRAPHDHTSSTSTGTDCSAGAPALSRDHYRRFGRTDLMVSPLGFGGAPIGMMESEQAEVGRILNRLLDLGVNLIDTAHIYRGSEAAIGNTVSHRRDEFVLVSKCGSAGKPNDLAPWSKAAITANIEESLTKLKTDVLDVILIHSCSRETLEKSDAIEAVVAARDAGKVRFTGYSGDNETGAWAATLPEMAVIQTSVSICDQRNIDIVLPETNRHDVGVMAKRPVANAAWKALSDQYEAYAGYAKPYHERFATMGLNLRDLGLADVTPGSAEEARLWPEIALRFTLSIDGVHVAITGTTKPAHVDANVAAVAKGPLPGAAVEKIRSIFQAADPDGSWPGLT